MIDTALLKLRVNNPCTFMFYSDYHLHYKTIDNFGFPIPVRDLVNEQGNQPLLGREEKGIFLMKWIRKQMEHETKV